MPSFPITGVWGIIGFVLCTITFNGYLYHTPPLIELCDNAIDDDGDGLTDLQDPDCTCEIIEPESLIPNPSFEEMDCCPFMQSQMDCATGWIQASEPTTDFIHMCNWMGWDEFPPPLPFPDGEGIMGFRDGRVRGDVQQPQYNWKEYAGACLLRPLKAGVPYVFQFYVGFVNRTRSPDINISFFGTPDCDQLPFGVGNEDFGCPTNGPGWVRLGSRLVSGGAGHKWVKTTIEITPDEDIAAIAIGPDCPPVETPVSLYYFFDDLTLADLASFQFNIDASSNPCDAQFILEVPDQADFTYQWYKDGIALVGETSARLSMMHGEGEYQVRIMHDGSCKLTSIYTYAIPVIRSDEHRVICEGDLLLFGDHQLTSPGLYVDTFKTIGNCDSIVHLQLDVLGITADTVEGYIFPGEFFNLKPYRLDREGDHLLQLTSSQNCDSLVLLRLHYYHVFIPNVFTPNGDGVNDVFTITSLDNRVETIRFSVMDRWGNQLYSGPSWNGEHHGREVANGVYTFFAQARMDDSKTRQFSGNITLLR